MPANETYLASYIDAATEGVIDVTRLILEERTDEARETYLEVREDIKTAIKFYLKNTSTMTYMAGTAATTLMRLCSALDAGFGLKAEKYIGPGMSLDGCRCE